MCSQRSPASPCEQVLLPPSLDAQRSDDAPSRKNDPTKDPWASAWFEYRGSKISGRQVPLGVLSEYISPRGDAPLRLTIHFTGYPDEVCPYMTKSLTRKHVLFNPRHLFFNSLKEAFVIMKGAAS